MILKRYLIFQWLGPFVFSLLFFVLLITVATFVNGLLRDSVTTDQVLTNFFFDLAKWVAIIIPFACLSASLFCLEKLRSKNELVAIYAAGFSYKHLVILITQITLIVAVVEFIFAAYLAPSSLGLKIEWLQDSGANFKSNQFSNVSHSLKAGGKIWFKKDPYYFSFLAFDKRKSELIDVTIYKLINENRFAEIISGKKAKFVHGETWSLPAPNRISELNTDAFPISDNPEELLINLGQKPEDLSKLDAEVSTLHPLELTRFIKQIQKSDINASNYEIQLYEKFAKPILCVLFALLPVLGFSSPNRRNSSFGKTVTFTLLFCVLYWLAQSTLQAMGNNNKIPSFLSVFSVPLLFFFALAFGLKRKGKLT